MSLTPNEAPQQNAERCKGQDGAPPTRLHQDRLSGGYFYWTERRSEGAKFFLQRAAKLKAPANAAIVTITAVMPPGFRPSNQAAKSYRTLAWLHFLPKAHYPPSRLPMIPIGGPGSRSSSQFGQRIAKLIRIRRI